MRVLAIVILALVGFCSRADEVLYWMVDNPTITTGAGESYTAANAGSHGPNVEITDARVAAFLTSDSAAYQTDRAGGAAYDGTVIYLDLYYQDGTPPQWITDPTATPPVDSALISGGIMTTEGGSDYAYSMASLGKLDGGDISKYSFAIELGAWSNPEAADADWILAAYSGTKTYDELASFRSTEIGIQGQVPWNPTAYSAPEPTSGLLVLIGGALLALRRKRV